MSPYVRIDVSGSSRVGASLYSEVDLSGVLVEGATPSSLRQDWSRWPLTARYGRGGEGGGEGEGRRRG